MNIDNQNVKDSKESESNFLGTTFLLLIFISSTLFLLELIFL